MAGVILGAKPPSTNPTKVDFTQSKESLELQVASQLQFFTKVVRSANRTQVVIPFSFEKTMPIINLTYSPINQEDRRTFLISHPQLYELTWPVVKGGGLSLYQKTNSYSSVGEFLDQVSDVSSVAIDPLLDNKYPQLQGALILDDVLELNQVEFILTSYQPLVERFGVYYSTHLVDASDANLGSSNEINWTVVGPQTSEDNPYLIGRIYVDYLQ